MTIEIDYEKLSDLVVEKLNKEMLNRDEVSALLGYGKRSSAFKRILIQDKSFPRPTDLVENGRPKWFKKDVLAWLEKHRALRSKMNIEASQVF